MYNDNDMRMMMKNMTYSHFRSHLSDSLDQVNENHAPILITRQSGKPAVVMSLDDYKSYEETAYLLSSVENAKCLTESIEELESGKGKARKLIEE